MTLRRVIDEVRDSGSCCFDDLKITEIVDRVERMAVNEIFMTHEEPPKGAAEYSGYDETTDIDTELLIKAPYDGIYLLYLRMQEDLTAGDVSRYNNSAAVFYDAYCDFACCYNRKKAPVARVTQVSF